MPERMKIAIVNDSIMALESLRQIFQASDKFTIAWVAHDGAEAVAQCRQLRPDIILMDLIMPIMDGVEATRAIMAATPCAIVVVTASVTANASKVFEAMGAGALDAINTPVLGMSGQGEGHRQLLRKIENVARLIDVTQRVQAEENRPHEVHAINHEQGDCLICIGASTGGPAALKELLMSIPADFHAPVVIIQHVDEEFANSFADWLDKEVPIHVRLAHDNDRLIPGRVLVAGRDDHLIMDEHHRLQYTRQPAGYAYRPSVNVFFESVAAHWPHRAVGVLLTGMGRDGGAGLLALKNAGCHTIAQDQATSAIYGMPKAAVEMDAAMDILALSEIAPKLIDLLQKHE